MLMTNFLNERKSVREFKNKPVSPEVLDNISDYITSLENDIKEYGIGFKIYENGELISTALDGKAGYSGVMIESPHYIGLTLKEKNDTNIIYSSYYMEKLITKLNELGINTCWLSVGHLKKELKSEVFGSDVANIDFILPFGYGKRRNPFVPEVFSDRVGAEELVFVDKIENYAEMEDLDNRGLGDLFYYIRFAPSEFNGQPWRYLVENDKLTLLLKYADSKKPNLIDAGIVMYYFEGLGSSIGLNTKWELTDNIVEEGEEAKYRYVAEIKL